MNHYGGYGMNCSGTRTIKAQDKKSIRSELSRCGGVWRGYRKSTDMWLAQFGGEEKQNLNIYSTAVGSTAS